MVVRFLTAALDVYTILLIVRIVFTWLPPETRAGQLGQLYEFLHAATEPVLRPFRRLLPSVSGMDLSPILLFILLGVVRQLLRRLY